MTFFLHARAKVFCGVSGVERSRQPISAKCDQRQSSSYNSRRINVLKYIDYRGSNKEIVAWYDKNKDKLVFDHYRKRYVLPDGAEFAAPGEDPLEDNEPAPNNAEEKAEAAAEALEAVEDAVIQLELQIDAVDVLVE